jgi:hypothetical protein
MSLPAPQPFESDPLGTPTQAAEREAPAKE